MSVDCSNVSVFCSKMSLLCKEAENYFEDNGICLDGNGISYSIWPVCADGSMFQISLSVLKPRDIENDLIDKFRKWFDTDGQYYEGNDLVESVEFVRNSFEQFKSIYATSSQTRDIIKIVEEVANCKISPEKASLLYKKIKNLL